jgi:tetratricopeptide (TPR) repeat protein
MPSTADDKSHLTAEDLYELIETRLPRSRRRKIEDHLDQCPECVEALAMVQRADRPASREEADQLAKMPELGPDALLERLKPSIVASSPGATGRTPFDWKPVLATLVIGIFLVSTGLFVRTRYWLPAESRRVATETMRALVEMRGATGRIPLRYLKEFERANVTRSDFDTPGPGEDILLERLRASVERFPTIESRLSLGLLLLDQGELDESQRLLEAVLEEDPDSAEALNGLAVLYYDKGDREGENAYRHWQRGLGLLRQAQALAPDDLRILYNFGMFYEALDMRAPAIQAWQRYLKADPGSQWSEEAAYHLGQLLPRWSSPGVGVDQTDDDVVHVRSRRSRP